MLKSTPKIKGDLTQLGGLRRLWQPTTFRRQLRTLKWLIPIGLAIVVITYELVISRWTYETWGFTNHLVVEIFVFATFGPLLALLLLDLLGRWIDEKETADWQSKLLMQANEKEQKVRQISDETLQVLFATSLLMSTIKSDGHNLPPKTITQIKITEEALNKSISLLRSHLMS